MRQEHVPGLFKDATKQEIFDFVVKKLFEQGEKSYSHGELIDDNTVCVTGCRYQLPLKERTLKCAVGHVIPDNDYLRKVEGNDVDGLIDVLDANMIDVSFYRNNRDLLSAIQGTHDDGWYNGDEDFAREMRYIAEFFSLSSDVIDTTPLNGKVYLP